MKSFVDKSQAKRLQSSGQQSKHKRSGRGSWQLMDNRGEALMQRGLAAKIQGSPQQAAQRRVMDGIQAQSAQLHSMDANPLLQHRVKDDEELIQGRFAMLQREGLEEEDPLQGKFSAVQRLEPEEDELLQGRYETVLRKGVGDEEEPLQGRLEAQPIQRAGEEKTNKTGMPDNLKAGIETLSGYSMDGVKVHYNSSKPAQFQAHAFAQGKEIHLASGQEKHLPHEAWHVVQQSQGRVRPTMQLEGVQINDDQMLEKEADVMGEKAISLPLKKQQDGVDPLTGISGDSIEPGYIQAKSSSYSQYETHKKRTSQGNNVQLTNLNSSVVQREVVLHRGYTLARARDAAGNRGSLDAVGGGEFGQGLYFWEDNPKAALISAVAYYGNRNWGVIKVTIPDDVYDEFIGKDLEFPSILGQVDDNEDLGVSNNKAKVDMRVDMDGKTHDIQSKMWVEEFRRMNQIAGDEGFISGGVNDQTSWGYDAIKGPSAADYTDYNLNQIKYENVDLFQDPRVQIEIIASGPPIANFDQFKMNEKNQRYEQLKRVRGVDIQFKKNPNVELIHPANMLGMTQVKRLESWTSTGSGSVQLHGEYKQLEEQQRIAIDKESEQSYYTASEGFEKQLGRYSAGHQKSMAVAGEMLNVIGKLARSNLEKGLASIPQLFGTNDPGVTGGVGMDAKKIIDVLVEGNFREKMTLIYNVYCNRQLSPLISNAVWGNPDPKLLFSRPVNIMRDRSERKNVTDESETITTESPDSVMHPPLSSREREFSVANDRLMWVPGMRRVFYEEQSEYVQQAKRLKVLAGGGMSGSAYAIIEIAMILGVSDLNDARLASLGWMLPAQDHTFYEIMQASTELGLEYVPGPLGYHFIDPLPESELEENVLDESGGHFPDYYLSEVFKDELAKH